MGFVSGIQQVGIGCSDSPARFKWLRQTFGIDVQIFDDEAQAPLMTPYTGGQVQSRRAILAMNMNGGGGAEIWQFTSRKGEKGPTMQWGDLGINAVKLKSNNPTLAQEEIRENQACSPLSKDPLGNETFWLQDEDANTYQVVYDDSWFKNKVFMQGGFCGAIIGVSNVDLSIALNVEGELQKKRIIERSSEAMYERFSSIWVPKEKAYQKETDLFHQVDYILEASRI
jgi:hypothetical protein